jgi:hypothetical protein
MYSVSWRGPNGQPFSTKAGNDEVGKIISMALNSDATQLAVFDRDGSIVLSYKKSGLSSLLNTFQIMSHNWDLSNGRNENE